MTKCSAPGCPISSGQGRKMNSFPKDAERRKKWVENVSRPGWKPGDKSVLCEIHFSPEMWEKSREDGKKKLKSTAVPTIFMDLYIQPNSVELPNSHRIPILRKKLVNKSNDHWNVHCIMEDDDLKKMEVEHSATSSPDVDVNTYQICHHTSNEDETPSENKYEDSKSDEELNKEENELLKMKEEMKKYDKKKDTRSDEIIESLRKNLKQSEKCRAILTNRYKKVKKEKELLKKEVKRLNKEVATRRSTSKQNTVKPQ